MSNRNSNKSCQIKPLLLTLLSFLGCICSSRSPQIPFDRHWHRRSARHSLLFPSRWGRGRGTHPLLLGSSHLPRKTRYGGVHCKGSSRRSLPWARWEGKGLARESKGEKSRVPNRERASQGIVYEWARFRESSGGKTIAIVVWGLVLRALEMRDERVISGSSQNQNFYIHLNVHVLIPVLYVGQAIHVVTRTFGQNVFGKIIIYHFYVPEIWGSITMLQRVDSQSRCPMLCSNENAWYAAQNKIWKDGQHEELRSLHDALDYNQSCFFNLLM